ncbi:MAG: isoleucine--tRNA ligase [Candidatus Dojkabacteria bacterium]|nr:MAG: isoleucine--tRNA ligase [Candidatus Dojkabacteria bacterium]
MSKSRINKVTGSPNFPNLEDQINEFWKKYKIFEKSIESRDPKNRYVFVDGPPFVTGIPHYGSLIPSIAKDVIPRYWTMRGKRVRRVWGWDCHGLPIEEKVNKKYGILSSRQLEEEMGIDRYIHECRAWVQSCANEWRWYIEKVGRWADMDNAYTTMSPEFMESVIWAFKQIYEKGYIYKGKRVSLFSTDTSTPVSHFEVAMDADNYREVEDLAIFVKFEAEKRTLDKNIIDHLDSDKPVYLVAWTTTPWTIPSNFALAVNPNIEYALVNFEGEYFILAKDRLEYTFQTTAENIGSSSDKLVKVLYEFYGSVLQNTRYKPIYDFFLDKTNENDFKVYLYDVVKSDQGTGVLHIAPAFGEEDFELGKKYGLSDFADIDEQGNMIVGRWHGVYLRDAVESIAEDLREKGNLLRSEMYKHYLPFYRGTNPLIYMAHESYFINIQKIKQKMLELGEDINWVPGHIKNGLWKYTLENSPDWAISRNRYWATIMPIWRSEDGDEIVIGSYEELYQLSDQITKIEENGVVRYEFEGKPLDLHRDVADKIVLKKNGKSYYRIPEVLDCWMDSGSVPFAELHYPFENKEVFEQNFPADYIVEYIPQVRAWFNVLHRISTIIFDKRAFTNVVCTGVLAGNDGRKMSKSFGNYPDPKDVLQNIGGEAVRLYLMGSPLMVGENMNWSDEVLNDQVKNILLPLWNIYKYFTIYADLHNWVPENAEFLAENVLDMWLEAYVKKAVLEYSQALEKYNIPESVRVIRPTIDGISSWWIRRSRERFVEGDRNALQNLYAALVLVVKGFAPQMVFITEEIYQNIVRDVLPNSKESVHLEDYPVIQSDSINTTLLDKMTIVREICSKGHSIRFEKGIKVRQPLNSVYVYLKESLLDKVSDHELVDLIKEELNVREIGLTIHADQDEDIIVEMDSEITPDLLKDGIYSELRRKVQNLRKASGLQIGQKAKLYCNISDKELENTIKELSDKLCGECYIDGIDFNTALNDTDSHSVEINDQYIMVRLEPLE